MTKIMFFVFCSIESIVNGMAEKTDESVNNLEIEYEVSFKKGFTCNWFYGGRLLRMNDPKWVFSYLCWVFSLACNSSF